MSEYTPETLHKGLPICRLAFQPAERAWLDAHADAWEASEKELTDEIRRQFARIEALERRLEEAERRNEILAEIERLKGELPPVLRAHFDAQEKPR